MSSVFSSWDTHVAIRAVALQHLGEEHLLALLVQMVLDITSVAN